jgi:glyoxylase-like metal-dependent hydrolase (beta-lactamase superfamily II)
MFDRWRIGAVTIAKVVEQTREVLISRLLPAATVEEARAIDWLAAEQVLDDGRAPISFHSFIVRAPGCTIVVDTCVGNDREGLDFAVWNGLQTDYLETFAATGVAPEAVDVVLCTHLHVDHIGWNTRKADGAWVPTFPNARYLIDRGEYEYWRAHAEEGEVGALLRQSLDPIEAAGLLELIDARAGHAVCDEVALTPTPGHTPGHVSVRITSQGETALITGDALHHPSQIARTDWGSVSDWDPAMAVKSRRALLSSCEACGGLLIGTHFAGDPAGRIRPHGSAWRFDQGGG